MSSREQARVFRPDPHVIIRGSVSCLSAGLIAGVIVAAGLFLFVALAVWLTSL